MLPTQPYVLSAHDIGPLAAERTLQRVLGRCASPETPRLDELAYQTIYAEQQRLERAAPDPRSAADHEFIRALRVRLATSDAEDCAPLLHSIVERYTREIGGHFDHRVYRVATEVVPPALSALLHGLALRSPGAFDIDQRVLIDGEVELLRALVHKGTVILAPTHVSNLDSLVLGSAIHRLGLPPFAYGAGLNLFTNPLIGFFMRHLGAYTVDRAKTDPLYRETLKVYTTLLLERGQHVLFFPGGTRSRGGGIETHLKKGLLGTAPAAVAGARRAGTRGAPLFVVPCTLTYPLVLEAASLIGDYLRSEGGAQYVETRDEFDRPRQWLQFFRGLRQLDQCVHLRIGRPLDWLGNDVDGGGHSLDGSGRAHDPARYLMVDGAPVEDEARDAEYTRLLAAKLLQGYRRDNLALPTSAVAYALFERLRRDHPQSNLFRFLRSLGPERGCERGVLLAEIASVCRELAALCARGQIRLDPDVVRADPGALLEQALATFATYHPTPILQRVGERIVVGDPGLLFYYRNRLDGYGLLGADALLPGPSARTIGWGR